MNGWRLAVRNPFASREEALRESEARYRELFEHVPDGVYETSPDGRILAANPALVRMLGYASEEELRKAGLAPNLYQHPEDRARFTAELARTGQLRNAEFVLRRRDGELITVLENARAVYDAQGRLLYYQGTLTDISERKAFERELVQARDQALEATRLRSAFIANVSHELRTPLHGVIGMAQALLESDLAAETRESVTAIHQSGHLLLELINEILDFSKIEAGRVELERVLYDPRDVVYGAAQMLSGRAAEKELYLLVDVAVGTPRRVWGDPARLRKIIANLASNAVKFTERGGVRLTLAPVGNEAGEPGLQFVVRDTGIGIAPEAQKAVFEAFQQADGSTTRRYGGTGLGLAIVRQLVELMEGSIEVESEPGRGTAFRIAVPAPLGEPASPVPAAGAGRRVCLVNQCEEERALLTRWIRSWNAVPVELRDGAELLGWLEGRPSEASLVVDELTLSAGPPQLRRRLRAWKPDAGMRLVALTSPVPGRGAAALRRVAEVLRLAKPVREDELRRALLHWEDGKPTATVSLAALAARVEAPAGGPRRVLVAEDNHINQAVIRALLTRLGYQAEFAADGHAAVAAHAARPFDMILMDCQMPELDGYGATAAIRKLPAPACQTIIVALTAHAAESGRRSCLSAGMDDFLSKPVMLYELAKVLHRWLGGRNGAQALDSMAQSAV